jgi:hypothetical protein
MLQEARPEALAVMGVGIGAAASAPAERGMDTDVGGGGDIGGRSVSRACWPTQPSADMRLHAPP